MAILGWTKPVESVKCVAIGAVFFVGGDIHGEE